MARIITIAVIIILLTLARTLTHSMSEGKRHVPLQIFYTFLMGFGALCIFGVSNIYLGEYLVGSSVFSKSSHNEGSVNGFTIIDDITKPIGRVNYKGDSLYYKCLSYDKTGVIVSGDSLFYAIDLKKNGDYLLAECQYNEYGDTIVTKAIMFHNDVKTFEKTFRDPSRNNYYRRIDFHTDKFVQTYVAQFGKYDSNYNEEFFHYDGSEPTVFESLFLSEDMKTLNIFISFFLSLIAGYFLARPFVRKELEKEGYS